MHQLGFELPERSGFGGLWSAMDVRDDEPVARVATEEPRHWVARSTGARSARVRAAIQALESSLAVAA
jgi:hypothetical protein